MERTGSGDLIPNGKGGLVLDSPKQCGNGHSGIRPGWSRCPRCGMMTTVFRCGQRECDTMTSASHHEICAEQAAKNLPLGPG